MLALLTLRVGPSERMMPPPVAPQTRLTSAIAETQCSGVTAAACIADTRRENSPTVTIAGSSYERTVDLTLASRLAHRQTGKLPYSTGQRTGDLTPSANARRRCGPAADPTS